MEFLKLSAKISVISSFADIKKNNSLSTIQNLLNSLYSSPEKFCTAYSEVLSIYNSSNIADIFLKEILYDENNFSKLCYKSAFSDINESLIKAINFDIDVISQVCSISSGDILQVAKQKFPNYIDIFEILPSFDKSEFPLKSAEDLYNLYKTNGFGYFARGTAFYYEDDKPCIAVATDDIKLCDLKGYTRQKETILLNTRAFMQGKTSNNILLYGDKGTGKSSTVKAVVNEFANDGLKIIELKIHQIKTFAHLCGKLSQSPFKFIVFIDDLSFSSEDENFTALKAFIEGGITGRPYNVIIYATSNRRHMVREKMSDRDGDEIHLRDSIESASSLSDRFGIEVTFLNPDKDEYLFIVKELAEEYNIDLPDEELFLLALRFATRKSGRSPRTARQFIYHELSKKSE